MTAMVQEVDLPGDASDPAFNARVGRHATKVLPHVIHVQYICQRMLHLKQQRHLAGVNEAVHRRRSVRGSTYAIGRADTPAGSYERRGKASSKGGYAPGGHCADDITEVARCHA